MDHIASSTHGKMVENVWGRWWTLWYVVDDGLQPWANHVQQKNNSKNIEREAWNYITNFATLNCSK